MPDVLVHFHDTLAKTRGGPGRHDVDHISHTKQPGRHDGQWTRSIFPDGLVHLLARFEQRVERRLGGIHHRCSLDPVYLIQMTADFGRVNDGPVEIRFRPVWNHGP